MPKISVIISTYNRASLLKEAIISVLNQSYLNFELIISDDGSTEDIESLIENFNDERIIYLKHDKNRGVSFAKNDAIKASKGDYIISLDDDDLMTSEALESLLSKIEEDNLENLGGVYGWSWWVLNGGKSLKITSFKEKGGIFKAVFDNQVFTNILLKRDVFNIIGLYDESLKSNEDYDFYCRLAKHYSIDFVPRILFVIRVQLGKHLSYFSNVHMESHHSIKSQYSLDNTKRMPFLYKLLPMNMYIKLSQFKNRCFVFMKIISNPQVKSRLLDIKEELAKEGISI